VYAAVPGQWLGLSAKAVLGDSFQPLEVFKKA
jgi:hypothetical protein